MNDTKPTPTAQPVQYFFFNADGKLVIESNRGIIEDGRHSVRLHGNFTCSAKTMAAILTLTQTVPVEGIDEMLYDPDEENRMQQALLEARNDANRQWRERDALSRAVAAHNNLPWYRRMFHKINIYQTKKGE